MTQMTSRPQRLIGVNRRPSHGVSAPLTRRFSLVLLGVLLLASLATVGCSSKKKNAKGPGMIPHEMYGGCQIQGRHYHNTHVFIGDQYEPSLTEWLKY